MRKINVVKNHVVLDVGCGRGRETAVLTSKFTVIAVDVNRERCVQTKNRVCSNANVIRADGEKLPFQPCSFHAVVAKAFLHHVLNPQQAINEMYRVLKHNGLVTIIDEPNHLNPLWHLARFLTRTLSSSNYSLLPHEFRNGQVYAFSLRQLEQFFRAAKFRLVKTEFVWLPYSSYSELFFKAWLTLEKLIEKTFIPHVLGQLSVNARK